MSAHKKKGNYLYSEEVRQKLKLKSIEARKVFSEKHPHADRFFKKKGIDIGKIREYSARLIGSGLVAGTLLLTPPTFDAKLLPSPYELTEKLKNAKDLDDDKKLITNILNSVLPNIPRPLMRNEEKFLERIFQDVYGIIARASLEGEHLNTTYGYIGIEQHLRRYPGDTLSIHGENRILEEGMAPGLSAWGYFANSKAQLSLDLIEKEKWYAVVQTLYLPDWNKRQPYLKNWYKHRKVFIINPENGKALVAAIADSGPAAWTGKQFGGSPEVMDYLGGEIYKKGKVLVFFVDDPENNVPLGPVEGLTKSQSLLSQK